MDANDLTAILRRHYLPESRPPGGLFAAEVGSPCGRRRADALWLPLTRAGGTGLVGHELKVSRSDVLAELSDPTKAEPWSQYCRSWWLVVSDPQLVDGLDIPEAWGIMAPPSGRRTRSMTVIRSAPKLEPKEPALGLRRLLAWSFYGTHERLSNIERDRDHHKRRCEALSREIAELRATREHSGSPNARRLALLLHAIEQRTATRTDVWNVDDDTIVRTVLDHERVRQATADARRQLEDLLNHIDEPLRYSADKIKRALAGEAIQ